MTEKESVPIVSDQSGPFVEIDGQKISLGKDFSIGDITLSDLFYIMQQNFLNSTIYDTFKKQMNFTKFSDDLRKGDTNAILMVGLSVIAAGLIGYVLLFGFEKEDEKVTENKKKEIEEEPAVFRDFTIEQLREFNGLDDKPIYVGLRGDVYDVSEAKDFYGEGQSYHCFAGRDASRAMAKFSFEEEELNNPSISNLSPFERHTLEDWVQKYKYYKNYPVVGKISTPPTGLIFTREELKQYNGQQENTSTDRIDVPIYIGLNGKVIDVSYGGKEMYAKGGPYHLFAGIDASRALAKMSFKPEDLTSSDLSDLTPEQLKVLADWEIKFIEKKKYHVVGSLN